MLFFFICSVYKLVHSDYSFGYDFFFCSCIPLQTCHSSSAFTVVSLLTLVKIVCFCIDWGSTTLIKKNAFFHIVVRGRVREERAREILLYVYVWILFYIYMDILSSAT